MQVRNVFRNRRSIVSLPSLSMIGRSLVAHAYRAVTQTQLQRTVEMRGQPNPSLTICPPNPSAEFMIETNAPPLGGYITSDSSAVTAGKDRILLRSKGWTDDYDDLPIMHSFGYVYGCRELTSIAR